MYTWKWARAALLSLLIIMISRAEQLSADNGEGLCCNTSEALGGLQFYGEFLYWKAVQDQTPFAAVLAGGVSRLLMISILLPPKCLRE